MADPNIPNLPTTISPDQISFFQAVKLGLEVLLGQGRNMEATRALRVSEYKKGIIDLQDTIITTNPTALSEDAPPPPTNLIVESGMWFHQLSWDIPIDEKKLISHIEIWVAINSQSRDTALLRGIVTVTQEMRGGKGYFTFSDFALSDDVVYWIRSVSYAGNHSSWCPPDDQGGYVVNGEESLSDMISRVLDLLEGNITANELYIDLRTEIEKITGVGPGSVNERISTAQEAIQAQIDEISSISQYDPAEPYIANSLIQYEGGIYKCTNPTTGNLPTNTAYWERVGDYSSIGTIVSNLSSAIEAINYIDASSTSASARQLASIKAQVFDPVTGLEQISAEILEERSARVNADKAISSVTTTLDASYNHPTDGLSTKVLDLMASHAEVVLSVEAWATEAEAGTLKIDAFSSRIGNSEAAIESIQGTIVKPDGTYAWDTTTIGTEVGGLATTVQQNLTSINGILGKYTVKIDNNGCLSGFGLISSANNGTPTSAFNILADTFQVSAPGGVNPRKIFTVGTINGQGAVGIRGDIFVDGTTFSNIIYAGKLRLDSNVAASAAYTISTGHWGPQTGHFACISRSAVLGFVCEKTNAGNGSALFGYCSNSAQTGAAVAGYNKGGAGSWGGFFVSEGGEGVVGKTNLPGGFGLVTPNKAYISGAVFPFTGAHIAYTNDPGLKVGQIVYSIDAWCFDICQNLIIVAKTVFQKNKRVVGVVCEGYRPLMTSITRNELISEQLEEDGEWTVKPEYQPYIDMLVAGDYQQVSINSLGEGGILVCADNGDIENGDYLCSADTAGYAMRQDDDLLHNYTVGKALETVVWADEVRITKLIACTYHCG